jgi:signal transduction histidine kinase/CheY-like chemotaxis protein/HPt (histidine-containing phosphotransfer) domain-containing protein
MAPLFVAGLAGASIWASPFLATDSARSAFAVWSDVPLILTCGLAFLLGGRAAGPGSAERRFWLLWAGGTFFWLLVHVLDIAGGEPSRMSPPLQLVRNLIYMGLYAFAAMALEQRPDLSRLDARASPYRVIQDTGAVVLVFGLFAYLALIPAALDPGLGRVIVSRALLFLVLDAYLLLRLALLVRQAAPGWRASYGALLAAVLFWAAADAGETLARARLIGDDVLSPLLDVLWLPPFVALALAVRLRSRGGRRDQEEAGTVRPEDEPRGSLLAGALLVPAVHLVLEGTGALPAATLNAQRLCAMSVVLALGLLAFFQERRVERDLRDKTRLLAQTNTELERLVNDLAAARDLAEAGNSAKSRFLANTSHEIRTPMNGVLGMAELLLRSSLNGEQRRLVAMLKQSAESLLAIIDDILDFSRIEAGRLELVSVEMSVRSVAEDVARFFALRARSKGLVLACEVSDDVPSPLLGDPGRLRQILVNLVGNAVKFTEQGEVELRVRLLSKDESGVRVAFDVRDTGIGISEAAAPRIFDEFLQADGSTTRRFGGTGLGLAISRRLAALMDGTIDFESEPGRGSTFRLSARFATAAPSAPGSSLPGETSRRPRSEGAGAVPERYAGRVLAVEDDAVNQAVIEGLLSSWGLSVEIAADGLAALTAFERERYDLVLMDCMMPGLDGFETTAAIRRLEATAPGRRTPIVALTASAMPGDRERCLAGGMDDYLGKPVRREELAALLERWLTPSGPCGLPEALDPEALDEIRKLTSDGAPLLGRVLDLYGEVTPIKVRELREALSRGDTATLRAVAHALKSSSANIGARHLAELCRCLEEKLRKDVVSDPAPDVARIEDEVRRVASAIEALKRGTPS